VYLSNIFYNHIIDNDNSFSDAEMTDLLKDVEELKNTYCYVLGENFSDIVELDRKCAKIKFAPKE
jgi:hypothetical protein